MFGIAVKHLYAPSPRRETNTREGGGNNLGMIEDVSVEIVCATAVGGTLLIAAAVFYKYLMMKRSSTVLVVNLATVVPESLLSLSSGLNTQNEKNRALAFLRRARTNLSRGSNGRELGIHWAGRYRRRKSGSTVDLYGSNSNKSNTSEECESRDSVGTNEDDYDDGFAVGVGLGPISGVATYTPRRAQLEAIEEGDYSRDLSKDYNSEAETKRVRNLVAEIERKT